MEFKFHSDVISPEKIKFSEGADEEVKEMTKEILDVLSKYEYSYKKKEITLSLVNEKLFGALVNAEKPIMDVEF